MTSGYIEHKLDANLYKSESAKILAVLNSIFGAHNIQLAEDVLQDAFRKALTHWQNKGVPDSPTAG